MYLHAKHMIGWVYDKQYANFAIEIPCVILVQRIREITSIPNNIKYKT